jgi:hypothetical protein
MVHSFAHAATTKKRKTKSLLEVRKVIAEKMRETLSFFIKGGHNEQKIKENLD